MHRLAGYAPRAKIGFTAPRLVAAMSAAKHAAENVKCQSVEGLKAFSRLSGKIGNDMSLMGFQDVVQHAVHLGRTCVYECVAEVT